jgi:hypothetical protein
MTDRETLVEMFKRQEIPYSVPSTCMKAASPGPTASPLVVEIGTQTWFWFNEDGSLRSIEAFE